MPQEKRIGIVIVDDNDVLRESLAVFFDTCEDMNLLGQAANGEEAIRLCDQVRPDVVLMDMMMPEMDGFTATAIIHRIHPQTQIIALTNYEQEDLVLEALNAGAISYLLKTVSIDELAAAIRAAAEGITTLPDAIAQKLNRHTPPSEED